ncbi:MAG: methionine--tRNA ligase [Patescibacteria group bacterium]|nr:methionine--tRNA ligase [Patescibacteria group bacterium]
MKDIINFGDFEKLDIRVGQVVEATSPDWSHKLMQLTVEFGEEIEQRIILAGIKEFYQPEELQGNKYLFVVNLAERQMGQAKSQGMMLMADEKGRPVKIEVSENVRLGTVVR